MRPVSAESLLSGGQRRVEITPDYRVSDFQIKHSERRLPGSRESSPRAGEKAMRLQNIQTFLQQHNMPFQYSEEDGCGSIDFLHRGLSYHIWEYPAPERGAQSNVRSAGRSEEFGEGYEEAILEILRSW